jgi:hypothetical protein
MVAPLNRYHKMLRALKTGVRNVIDIGGKPKKLFTYGASLVCIDLASKYSATKLLPHYVQAKIDVLQMQPEIGFFCWANHNIKEFAANTFIGGEYGVIMNKYALFYSLLFCGFSALSIPNGNEKDSLPEKVMRTSWFTMAAAGIGNYLWPIDFISIKNDGLMNFADVLAVAGFTAILMSATCMAFTAIKSKINGSRGPISQPTSDRGSSIIPSALQKQEEQGIYQAPRRPFLQ